MSKKYIIIVAVVIIIAGGAYYWQAMPASEPTSSTGESTSSAGEQAGTQDQTPSGDGEVDTSDWKTYMNTRSGYKISYPREFQGWNLMQSEPIDPIPEDLPGEITFHSDDARFAVASYNNTNIRDRYNLSKATIKEVIFGDNKFMSITFEDRVHYIATSTNFLVDFNYFYTLDSALADAILSTFEFFK